MLSMVLKCSAAVDGDHLFYLYCSLKKLLIHHTTIILVALDKNSQTHSTHFLQHVASGWGSCKTSDAATACCSGA